MPDEQRTSPRAYREDPFIRPVSAAQHKVEIRGSDEAPRTPPRLRSSQQLSVPGLNETRHLQSVFIADTDLAVGRGRHEYSGTACLSTWPSCEKFTGPPLWGDAWEAVPNILRRSDAVCFGSRTVLLLEQSLQYILAPSSAVKIPHNCSKPLFLHEVFSGIVHAF
jgi:hypothetical protein